MSEKDYVVIGTHKDEDAEDETKATETTEQQDDAADKDLEPESAAEDVTATEEENEETEPDEAGETDEDGEETGDADDDADAAEEGDDTDDSDADDADDADEADAEGDEDIAEEDTAADLDDDTDAETETDDDAEAAAETDAAEEDEDSDGADEDAEEKATDEAEGAKDDAKEEVKAEADDKKSDADDASDKKDAGDGAIGAVKTPLAIGIAAACAIGGFAAGHFQNAAPATPDAAIEGDIPQDSLDSVVVGQLNYDGQTFDITAKQAIMLNSSITDVNAYPTADMVLATARDIILEQDAEKRGVTVDDESMADFAVEMLGSSDYESLSEQYSIDVDSLKALIKSSYISQEIRKQVVGEGEPSLASPPAVPDDGDEDEATSEYYEYVIVSAGDEWDAEANEWADPDGEFAIMLADSETFDPKHGVATYDDALGAYQVLGSRYSAEMSSYDSLWNDYMHDLFANASVNIFSLVS